VCFAGAQPSDVASYILICPADDSTIEWPTRFGLLRRRGIRLSPPTIARLLRRLHFSLRTNRKRVAGIRDLDRDRQFRYLTRLRRLYIGSVKQ